MKPTHYDGMLEVVGVHGVVHMGQIQSGLRSATRIAQGGHVSVFSPVSSSVSSPVSSLFCPVTPTIESLNSDYY